MIVRILGSVVLLLLLAGCAPARTALPTSTAEGRATETPRPSPWPLPSVTPSPKTTPTSRPTATRTARPTRTSSPTPSPTAEWDLGQYFPAEIWPGDLPQWMEEPPEDRKVIASTSWGMSCTVSLHDDEGSLLGAFSPDIGNWGGCDILWSQSKRFGAVASWPAMSTWMVFLLIDRDGNQIGDWHSAYYWPVWSPTSDLLAYQATARGEDRLTIIGSDGMPLVVSEALSPRLCMACGTLPRWSPDGKCVALRVTTGDVAVPWDNLLCVACVNGQVSIVSLWDYYRQGGEPRWLDDSHILVREGNRRDGDTIRYLLFDTETETIRDVASTGDLTPTPRP